MSQTRMVTLFWVGATVVLGIFFENALSDFVFHWFRLNNPTVIFDWSLTFVLGYAIAIAIAIATWLQPRVHDLAFESAAEIAKISWPTRADVQSQTLAVIAMTVICAGILGLFDVIGSKVMTGWLPDFIKYVAHLGS